MLWKAAVTFEGPETQAPETIRVGVEAGSAATASARAIRQASKFRGKGKRYQSLHVLLERQAAPSAGAERQP